MKAARFQVLSREVVERIHAASMDVLSTVGVKVEWKPARDRFRQAGADVDDAGASVRIPEHGGALFPYTHRAGGLLSHYLTIPRVLSGEGRARGLAPTGAGDDGRLL